MAGSIGIGFWIAHAAFWLLVGVAAAGRRVRLVAAFVSLWAVGYVGSTWLTASSAWFLSYVAIEPNSGQPLGPSSIVLELADALAPYLGAPSSR